VQRGIEEAWDSGDRRFGAFGFGGAVRADDLFGQRAVENQEGISGAKYPQEKRRRRC